ncbi:MAG: hypothetical protein ACLRWQ_01560 [Flavonifractor plautii]
MSIERSLVSLYQCRRPLRHAPPLRHHWARSSPDEVGQPEPGRGGHDVHGRRLRTWLAAYLL